MAAFMRRRGLPGINEASSLMFDEYGIPRGVDSDDDALIPLYHFVYCSRAAEGVDDAEVSRIVEAAQRNNLAHGITGVLVFGSGVFFQWIEGPAAEIKKLIATLHRDKRHYDIVSLSQSEEERERLYPDWDMEKVEAEDIRLVLQDALDNAEDKNNRLALMRILEQLDAGALDPLGRG
ncbi:BLUF domain-containing protein [Methylobacterium sp. CM6241]